MHNISSILSHKTFREISKTGKERRQMNSFWPVGLNIQSFSLKWFIRFPAQYTALLLPSHPSVLSLVFISYNQPSLTAIPLTCVRECHMCSPSILCLLLISTDFTTCIYPFFFFLLEISTISWRKRLCLFYYCTTICLTPTFSTVDSIFKKF